LVKILVSSTYAVIDMDAMNTPDNRLSSLVVRCDKAEEATI
jgi:hypothetical protein